MEVACNTIQTTQSFTYINTRNKTEAKNKYRIVVYYRENEARQELIGLVGIIEKKVMKESEKRKHGKSTGRKATMRTC